MTALAPVPVRAIRTSPPHPAAAVPGARADAAKAQFEATGYRRAQAPEWLLDALACLVGPGAIAAAWGLIPKYGGPPPAPRPRRGPAGSVLRPPLLSHEAGR